MSAPAACAALTADESFWDPSLPVRFLGTGARLHGRRATLGSRDAGLLLDPWDSPGELARAWGLVGDLHETALAELAQRLDALHGTSHGLRYWRIVAGPWLTWYLHALVDRLARLRAARPELERLRVLGTDAAGDEPPRDTLEHDAWITTDLYNQRLYSRLMRHLGIPFEERAAPLPRLDTLNPFERSGKWKKRLGRAVDAAGSAFARAFLVDAGFSHRVELSLIARTHGRVWRRGTSLSHLPRRPLDRAARAALSGMRLGDGPEAAALGALLPLDLPQCLVETYREVEALSRERFPGSPRAIMTAAGWYFDEPFKQWAARSAAEGARLLGAPHGAFGSLLHHPMPSEEHERRVVDRYYTWGWTAGDDSRIRPMPAPKLCGRRSAGADNRKSGILMPLACGFRFTREIPFTAELHEDYVADQLRFAAALRPQTRAALEVRPHFADAGWDVAGRWRRALPDALLTDWSQPFLERLASCRLYVCDHCSTTYAEALAMDRPTILFWRPDAPQTVMRPEARPFFDALRLAGVLHDRPESAAAAVEAAYPDVEAWWGEPRRREAVARFRDRFARTSPDALALWSKELLDALA